MKDHRVFSQRYYATSSPDLFGSYFTLGILWVEVAANLIIICAATKDAADTTGSSS